MGKTPVSFTKIAVLGLGKVGRLAARLLHESGFTVSAFDSLPGDGDQPFERRLLDVSNSLGVRRDGFVWRVRQLSQFRLQ